LGSRVERSGIAVGTICFDRSESTLGVNALSWRTAGVEVSQNTLRAELAKFSGELLKTVIAGMRSGPSGMLAVASAVRADETTTRHERGGGAPKSRSGRRKSKSTPLLKDATPVTKVPVRVTTQMADDFFEGLPISLITAFEQGTSTRLVDPKTQRKQTTKGSCKDRRYAMKLRNRRMRTLSQLINKPKKSKVMTIAIKTKELDTLLELVAGARDSAPHAATPLLPATSSRKRKVKSEEEPPEMPAGARVKLEELPPAMPNDAVVKLEV